MQTLCVHRLQELTVQTTCSSVRFEHAAFDQELNLVEYLKGTFGGQFNPYCCFDEDHTITVNFLFVKVNFYVIS